MGKRPAPRIVAIAGGKGGVGKSTIAANLAFALGRCGLRVVLVDADLGAANLHTMLGVLHPAKGLADFHDGRAATLDQVVLPVGPGVMLIAGLSRPGAANMTAAERVRLLRALARLDCDCVVIDVGAGTSFTVIDLVATADHKLFVLTPHLPSLHNAYAQLKACVHRVARKLTEDETGRSLIDSALGHESKARTIDQLLSVLRPLDTSLADRIADTLARFGIGLVANQIAESREVSALTKMTSLIRDHLSVHAPVMATISRQAALGGSMRAGSGWLCAPTSEAAKSFHHLAHTLLDLDLRLLRGEDRVTSQRTIPLWIMRDLDVNKAS